MEDMEGGKRDDGWSDEQENLPSSALITIILGKLKIISRFILPAPFPFYKWKTEEENLDLQPLIQQQIMAAFSGEPGIPRG